MRAQKRRLRVAISVKHNRDSSKKEYALDCMEELQLVRARYDERDKDGKAIRPNFFAHVSRRKGYYNPDKKNYKSQMAPMDYVQQVINKRKGKRLGTINKADYVPIGEIFRARDYSQITRNGYVELVLMMVRDMSTKTRLLYQAHDSVVSGEDKRKLANVYFSHCINNIRTMKLSNSTIRDLIIEMDKPENSDIKRKLWSILFGSLDREFTELLKESKEDIYSIEECSGNESGDVDVFWLKFKYIKSA